MSRPVTRLALIDFMHHQQDMLLEFADRMRNGVGSDNWTCICNCVHLWESARDSLSELHNQEG